MVSGEELCTNMNRIILYRRRNFLPWYGSYPYSELTSYSIIFIEHRDHSSLLWIINVTDASGRLMRWRLRLWEFYFEIKYKKGIFNAQADTLSRLTTEGGTTVDVEEDEIHCYMTWEEDDESGYYDLLATMEIEEENLKPISTEELVRKQAQDGFCACILTRLDEGSNVSFIVNKEGVLTRTVKIFDQAGIPDTVRNIVLHIRHHYNLAGHPGGRKFYYTLRQTYYCPSLPLECY